MLKHYLTALEKVASTGSTVELEDRIEISFTASQLNIDCCNLQKLLDLDVAALTIDGDREDNWTEIATAKNAECVLNLIKNQFIKQVIGRADDATNLFFLSLDAFENWLHNLPSPFNSEHPFNRSERTVLWLNGITQVYVGECLSVIPPCNRPNDLFTSKGYGLPSDEDIRSQVHVLSDYSVKIEPSHFRLPNEAIKEKYLLKLFSFYQQVLASCLVKEFYSQEKVVISGIKRITTGLASADFETKLDEILLLEQSVHWVYAERPETRLLLLMDRLSLDLPDGCCLLPALFSHLNQALEQAQWRYEFVIKDRKEAHAKELADLQKDVKAASDSYSGSANELVTGLLKDALSSIFILSIGLLSRLADKTGFLESDLFGLLSKGLAVYLVIGVVVRVLIGQHGLRLAFNDLMYWKNVTRNHMSEKEFREHVEGRTKPYKRLYCWSVVGVIIIHLGLAFFVWHMPEFFMSKAAVPLAEVTKEADNTVKHPDSLSGMDKVGKITEKPMVSPKENRELEQGRAVNSEKVEGSQKVITDETASHETVASPN